MSHRRRAFPWRPTRRQAWLLRAACCFFVVYLIGLTGLPTLVPYVTAALVVLMDGWKVLTGRRGR